MQRLSTLEWSSAESGKNCKPSSGPATASSSPLSRPPPPPNKIINKNGAGEESRFIGIDVDPTVVLDFCVCVYFRLFSPSSDNYF